MNGNNEFLQHRAGSSLGDSSTCQAAAPVAAPTSEMDQNYIHSVVQYLLYLQTEKRG